MNTQSTFTILVVEDSFEKLSQIVRTLEEVTGIERDSIETVTDATDAKKQLRINHYDLLILDISLPIHKAEEINLYGGLELLTEISERGIYKIPTHIIGLTAHEDIFEEAQSKLGATSNLLIQYSPSQTNWKQVLKAGIEQRISAKAAGMSIKPAYKSELVIVCALPSELAAHRQNGWDWKPLNIDNDDTVYYEAFYNCKSGEKVRAIGAVASRMGMPAATALTMKMILTFRPRNVVMTGIMAGIKEKVQLGDLVVANPVWDWGSGKWVENESDKNQHFEPDPSQLSVDPSLLKVVSLLRDDNMLLYQLRKDFGNGAPDYDINLHVGPVASGASVLASTELIDNIIQQHRKVIGIEMEAYGVFAAVQETSSPKPKVLCIKTVVDYGNGQKNDKLHQFGCFASAKIAQMLAERYI